MKPQHGVTLTELLVTVAIMAILLTLAVPSLVGTLQSVAVSNAVNSFMADMRFARSEAVKRGGGVIVCHSSAPESATPGCSTAIDAGGWVSGWIVFHDKDSDGTNSSGDQLLRVQEALPRAQSILEGTGNGKGTTATTKFTFTATGRTKGGLATAKTLTFGADLNTTKQRVVCIASSGRVMLAGDGTASCS